MSGQPQNAGLGRMLASRRQTQTAALYRAAPDGTGMQLHTASLACRVYVPSGAPALQSLAELGGARASHAGELPYAADVQDGDELRIPPHAYIVERAIHRDTLVWCALSRMEGVVVTAEVTPAGYGAPLWLLGVGSVEGFTGGGFRGALPLLGINA